VAYINAHATSTPIGDTIEVQVIKAAFGDHPYRIPVNSTKSMIGHCLTSAAIMELIATVLQMQNDFVHPTINLTAPDPEWMSLGCQAATGLPQAAADRPG
jgi:3-oxoacyl-(acyl-carrier-protein) synthase